MADSFGISYNDAGDGQVKWTVRSADHKVIETGKSPTRTAAREAADRVVQREIAAKIAALKRRA